MLSHLRLHRRAPASNPASNPTSPLPEQQPSVSPLSSYPSPFGPDSISPLDGRPPSSSSTALPPTLPPITRVTSDESDPRLDQRRDADGAASEQEIRPQQPPRSPYHGGSGFIGGVALQNYRRDMKAQQAVGKLDPVDSPMGGSSMEVEARRQHSRPPPINTDAPSRPPPDPMGYGKGVTSFSTPTDLHSSNSTLTGRRPAGTRLTSDLPQPLPLTTAANVEPQKGKKGLPFLKNPMSTLLMRRKNSQNVPDLLPLPLSSHAEEPTYDPRIRGTRVHDFSAPRRSNKKPAYEPISPSSSSRTDLASEQEKRHSQGIDSRDEAPLDGRPARHMSRASRTSRTSALSESLSTVSQPVAHSPNISPERAEDSDEQHLLLRNGQTGPPVPPKDAVTSPSRSASLAGPQNSSRDTMTMAKTAPSTRTNRSRNMSQSEMLSSVPRHMKSTSSRFSFDMAGAAKQEKLLEERHRQRELEKQATEGSGMQDSRFDDFDEDSFDYDAMMDDDGLEERIPGVNADLEEDEEEEEDFVAGDDYRHDPDNDQENFAGFVFQRSNPNSSLASPQTAGLTVTPRDAEGNVIGFAMTRDALNSQDPHLSPHLQDSPLDSRLDGSMSGLGIKSVDQSGPTEDAPMAITRDTTALAPVEVPRTINEDELYFDDGMLGMGKEFAEDLAAEPEYDTAPFDESIFDNNDTDQFGRPVPGAFAQAQSLHRAANQHQLKRESDITSRLSQQSDVSRPTTAHTSLSVDIPDARHGDPTKAALMGGTDTEDPHTSGPKENPVAAYQAALAAAAYEAAASGKFQRASSSPQDHGQPLVDEWRPEDGDDMGDPHGDMDDYDMDDDAIIAEANASALANDSDGWYGQEFGFYSSPINQQNSSQNSAPPGSVEYGYANGGFFGPKGAAGLDRSTSGRMVSREPNLTPITERSEYSNRNSLMSMGLPPLSAGTPVLQSPGLAQLAMMADRGDEQMTLSALLRLRSKAWGGSQASLASSREGSPRSERGDAPSSPWAQHFGGHITGANSGGAHGHVRKNSTFSTVSRDSELESPSGSPTLTMAMPTFSSAVPPVPESWEPRAGTFDDDDGHPPVQYLQTNILPATELSDSPLSAASGTSPAELVYKGQESGNPGISPRRPVKGHRRQKGSSDSISYTIEEDSGETRWVMERRRTAESGEVEILEREVVEGGRI